MPGGFTESVAVPIPLATRTCVSTLLWLHSAQGGPAVCDPALVQSSEVETSAECSCRLSVFTLCRVFLDQSRCWRIMSAVTSSPFLCQPNGSPLSFKHQTKVRDTVQEEKCGLTQEGKNEVSSKGGRKEEAYQHKYLPSSPQSTLFPLL